ncbi:hypothetical protein GCM10010251_06260 [Streptomyces aurantiogriseus]|uniref:Uncharacterized protein n=1 Tax=Streptomyces aurantiogriseus TaxID=66870 RepID=A0A918F209_9ACTN|nr:hypothetical protein GCM10010251_06260 [Streptomyces aurantiogriseus]
MGRRRQADEGGECAAQAAQPPSCLTGARGEELTLDVLDLGGVVGRPLCGDGQSGALQQEFGSAAGRRPGPGCLGQSLVGTDAVPVGVDPAGQARPGS